MKLGLITDIHEQVEFLQIALDRFRHEQVDQVVVIGDVFETGEPISETCRLLAEARAIGVWGNHDYGLCCDPPEEIRVRFSASILGVMKSLRPRLEIDGCYFAHVEPWLDPEDIAEWKGDCPIKLNSGRYFVVVGALLEGRYAILDTDTSELVPFNEERLASS